MEDLFNSIYYYTNGFYSVELDSYLYETIPGYLHIGAFMLICSFVVLCYILLCFSSSSQANYVVVCIFWYKCYYQFCICIMVHDDTINQQ